VLTRNEAIFATVVGGGLLAVSISQAQHLPMASRLKPLGAYMVGWYGDRCVTRIANPHTISDFKLEA